MNTPLFQLTLSAQEVHTLWQLMLHELNGGNLDEREWSLADDLEDQLLTFLVNNNAVED
jgi:hypothetical protein